MKWFKSALYIIMLLLGIGFGVKYLMLFIQREKDHGYQLAKLKWLQESQEIEHRLIGLTLDDFLLESSTGTMANILSFIDRGSGVFIFVSISSCSACRDDVLLEWQKIYQKSPSFPLYLIAMESEPISSMDMHKLKGIVGSLNITYPLFFERDGKSLTYFPVSKKETPIVLLVDKSGKVILANWPSTLTEDESANFRKDIYEIVQE